MADDATSGGSAAGTSGQSQKQTGAAATTGQQKTEDTLTKAQHESAVSAAINEARKKWKSDLESTLADKSKDADTKIAELSTKAAEAERKAEVATALGALGVRNLNGAYLVAKGGGYISDKGRFDVDAFRRDNPEFFTPTSNANAGNGAGGGQPTVDVNAYIRQMAGVS